MIRPAAATDLEVRIKHFTESLAHADIDHALSLLRTWLTHDVLDFPIYVRPSPQHHSPALISDEGAEVSAQCRTSLAGAFANSASNCEISRIKSSKIRWRSAASEPNVISATVLASAVTISSTSMVSFSPLNEP